MELARFGRWWLHPADAEAAYYLEHHGGYEVEHLEEALPYCRQRRLAIDVGAHIGTWAVALSKAFERVVAFEPNPDSYAPLVRNLAGAAVAIPVGLADAPGWCSVEVPNPSNLGGGFLAPGGSVMVLPLDWYGFGDVDLIKLDVEGLEAAVIDGALETIRKSWPVLVVEEGCHESRYQFEPFAAGKRLQDMGYRLERKLNKNGVYVHP